MSPIAPRISLVILTTLCAGMSLAQSLSDYKPSPEEIKANYERSARLAADYGSLVRNTRLAPTWLDDNSRFFYRRELANKEKEYVLVNGVTGASGLAFDHANVALALSTASGKTIEAKRLPQLVKLSDATANFEFEGKGWNVDLKTFVAAEYALPVAPPSGPRGWSQDTWPADTTPKESPDKKWTARIVGDNVVIKGAGSEEKTLSTSGRKDAYFSELKWSPDSKYLIGIRVMPGDRKKVFLLESTNDTSRAILQEHIYDQPGDKVDTFDIRIMDPATLSERKANADGIDYGGMPDLRWDKDGKHFRYEKMDRGYGRWRVIRVDPSTGESKAIIDDDPDTFVDSTAQLNHAMRSTDEQIWRSERDGWGHLYITSADGSSTLQITKGAWVTRELVDVDEAKRTLIFTACGMTSGEDPYNIHYYRINLDGTGLIPLTPAMGNHTATFNKDHSEMVDTCSTITSPPVHELRRTSDGKLLATLEQADISELQKTSWKAPEPFVAKGRDGRTDIYGVVYRPSNFDPNKRYPVIEDIYAGPQDSFTPKTFNGYRGDQALAELGFIVVQCDGMGTRNRGKVFHDVCYKNLADAGLPDRIAWIKALAEKYSQVDADRVGIFGTSAGGQNSTGAVLFHPEFYKVAVSSCGCHDNRIDKIWWNEQWMGLMGPHYAEQSNITNAAKLQGNLLLLVGELDNNVPPESTYRLVDALEKAGKDFDFVVIPGSDHTAGGPFGDRKRRDFFVRHLLGVEPPAWR